MQTLQILPTEVHELALKVSPNKQDEVSLVLTQIFTGTADWESQIDSIEVKDINDSMSIQLAETVRKNSKQARLNAEKIFDAKRDEVQNLKAEFDLEDKLWLKAKQLMQLKFKAIEEKAEWKANFVKRFVAEQNELIVQKRIIEVSKYAEINRFEFENMSDESFNTFLSGLKSVYDAKIEAEKKAEQDRIAKEKAELEARELQRIENLKMKAEAEKREKEIAIERAKQAEVFKQQRAEAEKLKAKIEAKLKAERDAKAKIEAELRLKQDAEIKAENERKQAKLQSEKEAEKLAKAPIKKQLQNWVNLFQSPVSPIEHEKVDLILQKFEAFKKWAKTEIENS